MRKLFRVLLIVLVVALVGVVVVNYPRLDILTGFASKNVASGMFLAERSQESIEAGDNDFSPVNLASNKVDMEKKSVSTRVFGLKKRTAVYIEGLGAMLVNKDYKEGMEFVIPQRIGASKALPYPYGNLPQKDTVFQEVDYDKLESVVQNAFDAPGVQEKRVRTLLVVYKDQIIAEKYAEGFDETSLMLGWSMTKSITSTMYGILARKGEIDINEPADIPEWQGDARKEITYSDLLHMNSGLEWVEDYNTMSDVTRMLFQKTDMGQMQAEKDLVGKPDSTWNYSSGTTNLLAGPLLKKKFKTQQEYLNFWYRELLDKIGMHSATIETDLSGSYVGSSYGWANTRDWAKFGLLYLKRGNWNGVSTTMFNNLFAVVALDTR